ncbi:MAG: hypothetical protein J6Y62_00500 [Clostridia bacterium]|nr:hypothetical protein [Clostridia bacterium]
MKNEAQLIEECNREFAKRLELRKSRMLKTACRNCANKKDECFKFHGVDVLFYKCALGLPFHHDGKCPEFKCLYTGQQIEDQMWKDIANPAVCKAKEPVLATLIWVLNGGERKPEGFLDKLKRKFFKK